MKLLLILENHFCIDEDGTVWCDRIIDYNFLKRYLETFNNVIVCGRTRKEKNVDKKLLVLGKGIEFVSLPEFAGAKGLIKNLSEIKKILKKQIKKTDCVLYRAPTHLSLFTYKEVLKQNKILALEFMMAANKMIEGNGIISKILNFLIEKKAQKMCMKANGVSYVTEKVLQEKYPCRGIKERSEKFFTTNYSTIDLEYKDFYMQEWKKENKPKVFKIIHTGFMDSYRKGQDTLIKAVADVKKLGYNIELNLIGDGKRRKEFEELVIELGIEDIVKFKGLITDKKEILKYLRSSHILVFPTHSEGLPRTIIEAMSQGLPCISSPVDGIVELLDKEFLIDFNDEKAYAHKIIELINDWDKMIEISNKNYKKALIYEKSKLDTKRRDFYDKLKRCAEIKIGE